jgi:hypothetical protein
MRWMFKASRSSEKDSEGRSRISEWRCKAGSKEGGTDGDEVVIKGV